MRPLPGRTRRGFTLIELLVVILVIAILMAVALPLYLGAVSDSQRRTCRANMQTIANAEQAYRLRNPSHLYTTDMDALMADGGLVRMPVCPVAGVGAYSVTGDTVQGLTIHCSITAHGVFRPGIDSE